MFFTTWANQNRAFACLGFGLYLAVSGKSAFCSDVAEWLASEERAVALRRTSLERRDSQSANKIVDLYSGPDRLLRGCWFASIKGARDSAEVWRTSKRSVAPMRVREAWLVSSSSPPIRAEKSTTQKKGSSAAAEI